MLEKGADLDSSNEKHTHQQLEKVSKLVEGVPSIRNQMNEQALASKQDIQVLKGRVLEMASWLEDIISQQDHAGPSKSRTRSSGRTHLSASPPDQFPPSYFTDPASMLQALQKLTPALTKISLGIRGMAVAQNDKNDAESLRNPGLFMISELHALIADVHTSTATSYAQAMYNSSPPRLPKRFQRQTILKNQLGSSLANASEELDHMRRKNDQRPQQWKAGDPSFMFFSKSNRDGEDPNKDHAEFYVFCNPRTPGMLGVSIDLTVRRGKTDGTLVFESRINFCSLHDRSSETIKAIKAGDHGVSTARRLLKKGDAWAGDCDYYGRSLISVS
jgi:hypothetical protein